MKQIFTLLYAFLAFNAFAQTNLIQNGNMSSAAAWSETGYFHIRSAPINCPQSPSAYAWTADATGTPANNAWGSISQVFTVPALTTNLTLNYYISISSSDATNQPYDVLSVSIEDMNGGGTDVETHSNQDATAAQGVCAAYQFKTISLHSSMLNQSVSKQYRLVFDVDNDNSLPTVFRIDDVSIMGTTASGAVATPTLQIAGTTDNSISLIWNSVQGASQYELVSCNGSPITTTLGTSYTVSGLAANQNYSFKLRAIGASSSSPYSTCMSATTTNQTNTAPSTPTGVNAIATGTTAIDISWDAVPNAVNYKVYPCNNSTPLSGTVTGTSWTNSGLTANTTRSYQVKAFANNGLSSSFSICADATTNAGATGTATVTLRDVNAIVTGLLNYSPLTGFTAELLNANNTPVSGISISGNIVNVSNIGANYKVRISKSGFTITKPINNGNQSAYDLPITLLSQIQTQINTLNDLKVTIDPSASGPTQTVAVQDYNVSSSNSVHSYYNIIVSNNLAQVNESLARLYVAQNLIKENFGYAAIFNEQGSRALKNAASIALDAFKVAEYLKHFLYTSNVPYGFRTFVDAKQTIYRNKVTEFINKISNGAALYLDPTVNAGVDYAFSQAEAKITEHISNLSGFPTPTNFVFHEIIKLTSKHYTTATQPLLSLAANNSRNPAHNYNLTLLSSTNAAISEMSQQAANVTANSPINEGSIELAENLNDAVTFSASAGGILITSGFLAPFGLMLTGFATHLTAFNFSTEIGTAHLAFKSAHDVRVACNTTLNSISNRTAPPPTGILSPKILNSPIQLAATDLKSKIDAAHTALQQNPTHLPVTAFYKIDTAQLALDNLIQEQVYGLEAKFGQASGSIANYDSLYFTKIVGAYSNYNFRIMAHNLQQVAFALDSTNTTIRTNLIATGNSLKVYTDSLLMTIDYFNTLTTAINAPAYNIITKTNLKEYVQHGNTQTVNFVVSNKGGAAVTDLYAKITLDGGFTTTRDSMYIGQLGAGQSNTISTNITAPNIDTIGGYQLVLYSPSGAICSGKGGALVASAFCTNVSTQITDACYAQNTGNATLTPANTSINYTYQWSSGQNTATVNNLAAGTYTVTVADPYNACPQTVQVNVFKNPAMIQSALSAAPTCNADDNGSIQLRTFNLYTQYNFIWENNATTSYRLNLPNGTYSVIVTEPTSSCVENKTFNFNTPTFTMTGAAINTTCLTANDGSIVLTPNYTDALTDMYFTWSNGANANNVLQNLAAGTYTVTITHDFCTVTPSTFTFTINTTNTPCGTVSTQQTDATKGIYLYPNPVDKGVLNIRFDETGDYVLRITNTLGANILQQNITATAQQPQTINLQHLPQGTYFVSILTEKSVFNFTKPIIITN